MCSAVVYQHDADEDVSRTHVHALVLRPQVSIDTMKRWIKQSLGVEDMPKSDWSFKNGCDRNFITYMSKGKLEPVQSKSLPISMCNGYRDMWVEHVKTQKDVEVTSYTMAEELAKWIDMDTRQSDYDPAQGKWISSGGDEITERDIVRECIKIHNKYRKGYCDFSLVRVIQTAYGICGKSRWKDALVEKVMEKLSPFKT